MSGFLLVSILVANFILNTGCFIDTRFTNLSGSTIDEESISNPDTPIADVPVILSYSLSSSLFVENSSIADIVPAATGGALVFSISPALPQGLNLDTSTGTISGSPTSPTPPTSFTITATNGSNTATAVINFQVAADFLVNTTTDSSDSSLGDGVCADTNGFCSLRAATEEASALVGVLTLAEVPAGTYGLTSLPLTINSRFILTGAGATATIIDANPDATPLSQALIIGNYEVTLDGFAVKNASGAVNISGKGISSVSSNLTLNNCTIQNNSGYGVGGGLYLEIPNSGAVVIQDCLIDGNATLINVSYSGNGAGIYATSIGVATLTINNSTISNNTANGMSSDHRGGGLYIYGPGLSVSINNSTFDTNYGRTGGGLYSYSSKTIAIESSIFTNNEAFYTGTTAGGAIHLNNTNLGDTYSIKNSTFTDNFSNSTGRGGIIYANGNGILEIDSSTFSGSVGNSISAFNFLGMDGSSISNSTINTSRGIRFDGTIGFTFTHSTLDTGAAAATNFTGGSTGIDFFGTILKTTSTACLGTIGGVSLGYNISSDSTCTFLTGTGDLNNTDAGLSVLGSNGGPTPTMSIGSGSAAKDLIPAVSCIINKDQRGTARPSGSGCDAGAFEL